MQAEDLLLHHSSDGQVIEQVCELLPHIGISVLSQTLVIEAIHLCDLSRLVVTSKNGHTVLIPHFESDQQCDSLHTVVTSVDIVAHEQIVGFWHLTSYSEQLHQIVELAMDVPTNGDWHWNSSHISLLTQYLFSLQVR